MPKRKIEEFQRQVESIKQKIRNSGKTREAITNEDIATLLTGYSLEKAKLYEKSTNQALDKFLNQKKNFYSNHVAGICNTIGKDKLIQQFFKADDGKELAKSLRTYTSQLDHIPEDCPYEALPLAGGRVTKLKERMKKGEFDTPEKKRACLAEIIGARRSVGAGRSSALFSDGRLFNKVGDDLFKKISSAREELNKLSDEQVDRLFEMGKNHGYAGAMQEKFEELTISPAEREIKRLKKDVFEIEIGSEEMRRAAAEMVWLEKLKALPFDEQKQALESDEHETEVETIRNSAEFVQMLENNDKNDLYDMLHTEDNKELNEQMQAATQEIANDPFGKFYDELMKDPQKLQQYQQIFTQLSQNDKFREAINEFGPGDLINKKLSNVQYELSNPGDKYEFVKSMRAMQSCAAFITNTSYEKYKAIEDKTPQMKTLFELLNVPKHETAAEYDLALKSMLYLNEKKELMGEDEQYLLRRTLLHEMVGDAPGWEDKPFTQADVVAVDKKRDALQGELSKKNAGVMLTYYPELSDTRKIHKMLNNTVSESAAYIQNLRNTLGTEKKEEKEQSPQDYLDELLTYPLKKAIESKESYERDDDISPAAEQIMAARALAKDASEHPEAFPTKESMENAYQKYRKAFNCLAVPAIKVEKGVLRNDDGKSLSEVFRKSVAGSTGDQLYNLPAEYRPTAKEHIEALITKAKNHTFQSEFHQKRAVASIIAIRQTMNIKPGGDRKLNNTVTSKAFKETENIMKVINRMPEDDIKKLISKIPYGHGGKLMEEFNKLNTYENYIENQKRNMLGFKTPRPKEVAEVIAAQYQAQQDGMKKPADLTAIKKISEAIQNDPAYIEMMKDKQTLELMKKGDIEGIKKNLIEAHNNLEHAANNPEAVNKNSGTKPDAPKHDGPNML